MTAPSNANTSGLEVVAYSWEQHLAGAHWSWRLDRQQPNHSPEKRNPSIRSYEPLVTAAAAQARIAELEGELEEARTIDAGFWAWLGERELQPDGPDVEWGDIVVALTEHEDNAYDIADKATDRATAAEARADRLSSILGEVEPYVEVLHSITQAPDNRKTVFGVLKRLRAALQQEG